MKFNPQNFKLMKFRKIVMSQNLKTTKFLVMILDDYMVSSQSHIENEPLPLHIAICL